MGRVIVGSKAFEDIDFARDCIESFKERVIVSVDAKDYEPRVRGWEEATGLDVRLWDERLTTVQAERAMIEADMSRAKRKKRRDKVAAQIFLQSYLDAHRASSG